MGSFDYTCAISGLPIAGGEAVRYLLLTQNPYHQGAKAGSFVCYTTDHWFPRVFPIRAKYDDYGAAEKLQGKAQQAVWLRGFRQDLVESGWGPNTIHDVAMSKKMPLNELLDGIHHGRLHVRRELHSSYFTAERKKEKIPSWIPTRKRVEKYIAKLGLKNYDGNWGSDAFIVNRVDRITVKVRDAMRAGNVDSSTKRLLELRDALSRRYAGMVTCGTDGQEHAELLLRPLPGIEPRGYSRRAAPKSDPSHPAAVANAMIREDVWQAIVALPFVGWDGKIHTAETLRKKCIAAFKENVAGRLSESDMKMIGEEGNSIRDLLRRSREILDGGNLVRNAVPFAIGPEESWSWMADAVSKGEASKNEAEDFCNTVAEFLHISSWLSTVRFLWHPAGGGPQNGEHEDHLVFLSTIRNVASENAWRQKKETEADGEVLTVPKHELL